MNWKVAGAVSAWLSLVPAFTAAADDEGWHGEITPYVWGAGIEDSVTVEGHKADVEIGIEDLLDKTRAGGLLLGILQRQRLILWGQVDYLDLSTDELKGSLAGSGHLDSTATVGTLAAGYQFDGFGAGQSIALLLGARQLSMDNELTIDGVGTFKKDMTFTDAVLLIRPDFRLSNRWRFNLGLSYGLGGDSDETCDVWPQIQYAAADNWAVSVGYRKLRYAIEEGNNKFDGGFHGYMFGLGYRF